MRDIKKISTGIPALDERLGGGILSNSIVLLSIQTGVTLIQFTQWNVPKQMDNPHIILVNFALPAVEFLERSNVKSISRDENTKVQRDNLFTLIDCFTEASDTVKKVDGGVIYQVQYPFDPNRLYSTMKQVREDLGENKSALWVFDSLTDMSIGVSEEELVKFCRRVFRFHKSFRDIAFYLLNWEAHEKKFRAIMNQLADVVIEFKVEEKQDKLKNYLQVIKGVFLIDTKKLYYEVEGSGETIFYNPWRESPRL